MEPIRIERMMGEAEAAIYRTLERNSRAASEQWAREFMRDVADIYAKHFDWYFSEYLEKDNADTLSNP